MESSWPAKGSFSQDELPLFSKPHASNGAPTSRIPRITSERLVRSACDETGQPTNEAAVDTVLYLAYGSNMSAETFRGARGIKPLGQVGVSVPTLRLVFDLPAVPYLEPCMANVAMRKIPKKPVGDPTDPPIQLPPPGDDGDGWGKGLVGVVYEVTREDYTKIIATEGGGSSYKEIVVPCIALPPRMSIPERPSKDLPRPFLARTLFAPQIPDLEPPDKPGHDTNMSGLTKGSDGNDGDGDGTPSKKWWWRFTASPRRPDPDYAQPSLRYLTLLRNGAVEHELPNEYQDYLNGLQPYTVTTRRQRIASTMMSFIGGILLYAMRFMGGNLTDDKGKFPVWLMVLSGICMNLLWTFYDWVMKPIFGDGERTQEDDDSSKNAERMWSRARRNEKGMEDEKKGLLQELYV